MEKFYLETPTLIRKKDAIDFINEFIAYNSNINGTGGLQRYLDNYEGWLNKLQEDYNRPITEEKVPAKTFFLIRSSDNKVVGMVNIRLALNEKLINGSGNIGYSIRPTERKKGYNKTNLYLALKVCQSVGIDKALLDADINNIASWKTIESLGGKCIREGYDNESVLVKFYEIDVMQSLTKYQDFYEPLVSDLNKYHGAKLK